MANASSSKSGGGFILFVIVLLFATTFILVATQSASLQARQGWAVFAFLVDLLTIAAIVFGIGFAVTGQAAGIALSSWNDYSLSRLQMALWTIVVLAGLLTAAKVNLLGYFGPSADALDIKIPGDLLAAMGIAAFSAAASPAILALKSSQTAPPGQADAAAQRMADASTATAPADAQATGRAMGRTDSDTASWLDIVSGDETANAGLVDLSKVQQLLITLLLLGTYCFMLVQAFGGATAAIGGLPDIGQNFVQLLAVSHAGYLVYKAVPKSGQPSPSSAPNVAAAPPNTVGVRVAMTGADAGTIRLLADGQPIAVDDNGFAEFFVPPGAHTLTATGTAAGAPRQASLLITPAADSIANAFDLALT